MIRGPASEVIVRRIIALVLALLVVGPAAVTQAARQPEAHLCVVVTGAPDDVTPQELAAGIADGSYVITSTRPCAMNQGPHGDGGAATPEPAGGPIPKDTGQWIVNPIERDPLTDEPVASTWVFADGSNSIALVIRCVSRAQTEVYIFWNAYLEMESASITTRMDDDAPLTQAWPVDAPGTSSFYPTDELVFINDLMGATRLVAKATPWNQEPITVIFPVTGIEAAVANVRSACGW
jgi:hypothetical protein